MVSGALSLLLKPLLTCLVRSRVMWRKGSFYAGVTISVARSVGVDLNMQKRKVAFIVFIGT